MEQGRSHDRDIPRRNRGAHELLVNRPDRIALWAVFLAVFAAIAAAASGA
jgi:hypothetical protein